MHNMDDFIRNWNGDEDMAEVTKFEDMVKDALKEVMRHAVGGHHGAFILDSFCNNPDHALKILSAAGIRPVNDAVAARVLDKRP